MITLTTPVGRIVSGHPMVSKQKLDDNKQPKFNKDGTAQMEAYFALAIPKGVETHWNQTVWGQQIYNEGTQSWPRGEHGLPSFAWKIADGDSRIPNTKMKINADREGWAGHWVISFSTQFNLQCFHPVQNGIFPQMQSASEIKCGDYAMVSASFKSNESTKTAGMYANPNMVLLVSSGVAIVGGEGDPTAAFGNVNAQLPAGAQIAPATYTPPPAQATAFTPPPAQYSAPAPVPTPMATGVVPAPDFLHGTPPPPPPAPAPERVLSNGYTASALRLAGWPEASIVALG